MKKLLLIPVLLFAACEDAKTPLDPQDAGTPVGDLGVLPDSGRAGDAGLDAGAPPDALGLRDAALVDGGPGDESIRGTALEGVQIQWPERMELCSEWRENRSIEDERADQAVVTLFSASRPSLGSGHLSEAKLGRIIVRRGPLAAEQWGYAAAERGSQLTHYDLRKTQADTTLSAELEHDLGAAGVLYETFSVYRRFGNPDPVIVGGSYYEHALALMRPGATEPVYLFPCGGRPELDRAFQVLSATNGVRSLTILRQANTAEALAGSAPVHLNSAVVTYSDRPYEYQAVQGRFAQTYAAMHHNWQETSVIDFKQDPGFYQTIYGPYLAGMTPVPSAVTEIRMHGIDGFGEPMSLEVDTLELDSGTTTTEEYTVMSRWQRVDRTYLLRSAQAACAAGGDAVSLTGWSGYSFQLLTCPQSSGPGFDLEGLVPVFFEHDMSQVGRVIDKTSITEIVDQGRPGFSIDLDGATVTISKEQSSTFFFVKVVDDGGDLVTEFGGEAYPFDFSFPNAPVKAENGDATVSLDFDRLWVGQGVGESSIYAPRSFELTFDGRTVIVDAFDRLEYVNSHHNWRDSCVAKGDGLTITWEVRFTEAPGSVFVRAVRDSDGAEVLPETELLLVESR